jgi:phospholipid/cholesterol/gamma-HCH transport system substrate-binding protein
MRLFEESDPRFKAIQRKVGLFVIVSLAGILGAVLYVGAQRDIFTPKTATYFVAESGKGIKEGMAVKLSGFMIGKVKRLSLDEHARVSVRLSINTKYMKWIKTDSIARLVKEGLIGEDIIEITPGAPQSPALQAGGRLPFERAADLGDMAEEVKPVIKDIKEFIRHATGPEGGVRRIMDNAAELTGDLKVTNREFQALIRDGREGAAETLPKVHLVLDSAEKAAGNMNAAIEDAGALMARVSNGVAPALDSMEESLENVRQTTGMIKNATEQAAPEIPGLVERGREAADGTTEIMDAVKDTWPIKRHIKARGEKTLRVDSVE